MIYPDLKIYEYASRGIVFTVCSNIDIMSHYLDFYIENRIEEVPKDGLDDMKKLLSFCCGFMPFLNSDAIFGCTVSLPLKERKHFCVFDMEARTFVARSHRWLPKEYDANPRIAVQNISCSGGVNTVSMVDCVDEPEDDQIINKLLERYFEVHGDKKYKMRENGSSVIIIKDSSDLPSDFEVVVDESEVAGEYYFNFDCGCNPEKMKSIFSVISKEDKDFLFDKTDEIEIECPRCGLKYVFQRGDLENS